ncbi:hypothetical protein ACFRAM_28640, partial [Paenibacillus sp. NPDC056722]|uniref:hypothetical protein n=1 Tax=Paenibacillus sp. NPDC056722 TaxID=3345924 RepID=UPI00368DBEF7
MMSRRFVELFTASNEPGWKFTDLLLSYLVILVIAVVIGLVLTAIQLLCRNPTVSAYTAPGTAISARFYQDSLELVLTTGVVTVPFRQIKDLLAIGGGVFLRQKGTRGMALPGGLFTPAGRNLIDAARGRAAVTGPGSGSGSEQQTQAVAVPPATAVDLRKPTAGNSDRK